MPLSEGTRLGPYEIVAPVGAGGMGEVYRARDTRLGRAVAIKVLPAGKMADEDRKRRFVQEAKAASALNHPNIVTVYDIASGDGADFLVMEYVDGQTLGRVIPKHGMRTDEVLRCAVQIADALAAAHAAGIIHRDLKPGNIMVTGDGRVKLLDFGLAKLKEPAEAPEDEATRTIEPQSAEGTVVGTAAYMSPEQAEAKPVDARSDIFSFGAVLYEMVTGSRAFHGDSNLSTMSAVLKENPKPPSQVVADVPRELERIITRCLRKDPARRFQAMPDLKVALQELKEESDSGTAEIAGASAAARPGRSSRKPLYGSAALGALAIAGAGWFFLRPSTKPLPAMQSVPLTTYAGAERFPTFSPDGSQVAFTWSGEKRDNWDIYVKLVDGGAPLRLTTDPAPDIYPAWSPDGRQIAFTRNGVVYSISPLGGPERKLMDGYADSVAWMPDGQSLLISSAKARGELYSIFQLSLRTGEMHRITSPAPQLISYNGDFDPAISPDGRTLAFIRSSGAGLPGEIYTQALAGGSARRLTKSSQQLGEIAWANNSEILFTRGIFGSGSLWRVAADGKSDAQPVLGAVRGAADPAVVHPPGRPARLAYAQLLFDGNIWRMEIASEPNGKFRTVSRPAALVASTRMDQAPQFSPDGKRIAFASDRDGYMEIWVSASDGSNPQQLTTLKSARSGSPKWSPDGRQIVFDSLASGNNDLWIVGSEGGPPKQITKEPSNDARPSWSRDGRWIYFRSDRSGSQQIWRIPGSEPYKPAVQITRGGAFEAVESPDGKLLYYIKSAQWPSGPGIWSVPVVGGPETPVLQAVRAGNWAVAGGDLYYFDLAHRSQETVPLLVRSLVSGNTVQLALIPKVIGNDAQVLAVSQDGRWIAWTQIDHQDADLMLIDNFR